MRTGRLRVRARRPKDRCRRLVGRPRTRGKRLYRASSPASPAKVARGRPRKSKEILFKRFCLLFRKGVLVSFVKSLTLAHHSPKTIRRRFLRKPCAVARATCLLSAPCATWTSWSSIPCTGKATARTVGWRRCVAATCTYSATCSTACASAQCRTTARPPFCTLLRKTASWISCSTWWKRSSSTSTYGMRTETYHSISLRQLGSPMS
eukprot:Rmarinus@m.20695